MSLNLFNIKYLPHPPIGGMKQRFFWRFRQPSAETSFVARFLKGSKPSSLAAPSLKCQQNKSFIAEILCNSALIRLQS
jgi:hypothetical protein